MITASHCTLTQGGVQNTIFHQPDLIHDEPHRIGNHEIRATSRAACAPSGSRCRYSDSAFVRIPHTAGPAVVGGTSAPSRGPWR